MKSQHLVQSILGHKMADFEAYHSQLRKLLPRGDLWQQLPILNSILTAWARCLEIIDRRMIDLAIESSPLSATETLDEWEKDFGLPDNCHGPMNSTLSRQIAVWQKMVDDGSSRKIDYINLAARMGYTIEINRLAPLRVGARIGDRVNSPNSAYIWEIKVLSAMDETFIRTRFRVGSRIGERIDFSSSFNLECAFRKIAPSHIELIFDFSALGENNA